MQVTTGYCVSEWLH